MQTGPQEHSILEAAWTSATASLRAPASRHHGIQELRLSWPGLKTGSQTHSRGSGRGGNSPQDRAQPWRNSACFSHSFSLSRHKLFLQEALRHLTLPLSARGGGCPQRGPCLDPNPIFPLGPFSYPRGGLYLPSHSSELLGSRHPPFPSPRPALPPNPSSNVPSD